MKILFFLAFLSIALTIDTDLFAIIISGSNKFENYRHSINPLLVYNFLKKNNIPDENVRIYLFQIILGLSEFHACTARSIYPGKLYLTDEYKIINSCNHDISIDYKGVDLDNFQVLDIFRGRHSNMVIIN
jgi:glycosylphosphatidylinositol transamidase (GPIT) subunit GPI8